jgi:leucyl/phenylalanyl-tRNA--protein transferase
MARRNDAAHDITPELLLRAYACGIFPMAESADDPAIYWVEPRERGVIPIEGLHVPSRLARTVRADTFEIRIDTDFAGVIAGCAAPAPDRRQTWINARIRALYGALYDLGHAHTVEAWQGGTLVGGLYGVRLGAAFFGESMFQVARDASKVALVHLVARLRVGGFQLLDTQFVTPHLARFGAHEVPRRRYRDLLDAAARATADFYIWPPGTRVTGAQALEALAG